MLKKRTKLGHKISCLILLFTILIASCSQADPTLEDAVSNKYQVGDRWSYYTRPGEALSTFIVTKIDKTNIDGEPQTLIHIYVDDLAIEHPSGGTISVIPHMPFTETALDRSAVQPFDVIDPLPAEAESAYQSWRETYEAGDASVFDVSIAHALDNLEATLVQSSSE